jgi:hypothetical protein
MEELIDNKYRAESRCGDIAVVGVGKPKANCNWNRREGGDEAIQVRGNQVG